jgi:hypothetical protein
MKFPQCEIRRGAVVDKSLFVEYFSSLVNRRAVVRRGEGSTDEHQLLT